MGQVSFSFSPMLLVQARDDNAVSLTHAEDFFLLPCLTDPRMDPAIIVPLEAVSHSM